MNTDQIREILNRHDVMGLLRMGAPDDEYTSEAEKIYSKISQDGTHDLGNVVFDIFQKSFAPRDDPESSLIPDTPESRQRFEAVAADIRSLSPLTSP